MKNSAHRAAKLLLLDNATPAVKFHYVTAAGAARKYETTGPLDSVVVFSDSMDSLTPDFIHTMEEKGSRLIIMCNKGVVRDAASRMVVYKEPTDDHDLLVALSRIADGLARERRRRF
ncbi:hypothetical protein GBA52_025402 [Prunus armeniaca]|nr:hypothetical protein GBA52_025402 [Prunus armeniaca]